VGGQEGCCEGASELPAGWHFRSIMSESGWEILDQPGGAS
jgi:hypothetical protein